MAIFFWYDKFVSALSHIDNKYLTSTFNFSQDITSLSLIDELGGDRTLGLLFNHNGLVVG